MAQQAACPHGERSHVVTRRLSGCQAVLPSDWRIADKASVGSDAALGNLGEPIDWLADWLIFDGSRVVVGSSR